MSRFPVAPLLVLLVGLCAMAPVLGGGLVYDDHHYLAGNPAVAGPEWALAAPLGDSVQGLWRPLTVLSWRLQWGGPEASPWALHLVDLALHLGVALALLALGTALGLSRVGATLGALLFAAHPVHAEAVAWVSGRAELLAALFTLLAWRAHLASRRGAGALAAALVLLAALSKENALAAPALFVVADLLLTRRPRPWARWAGLAGAVLAAVLLRLAMLEEPFPAHGPFRDLTLLERLPVAAAVFARALGLVLWPAGLRVEYDRDELLGPAGPALLVCGAFVLAVALLARAGRRRVAALLLLFPVALLPVLQLVPIGEPFAERFLYLPSALVCLAAGALLAALDRREAARARGPGLGLALAALLLAAAVPAARAAVQPFRSDLALWAHAARQAPHVPLARYNHGLFLDEAGRFVAREAHLPGSRDELRASLDLDPRHGFAGYAHQLLAAHALGLRGPDLPDHQAAARHARVALSLAPALVEPRLRLAEIALDRPAVVSRAEALEQILPLLQPEGLTPEQVDAAGRLFAQLSAAPPAPEPEASSPVEPTGTSSDEGS